MAGLGEIRAALASTIAAAVEDLTAYELVPEQANVPCFTVVPRSTEFVQAFGRGLDTYAFDVLVLVGRRDDKLAQTELDAYVNGFGPKSIREAVWNARDLGIGVEATVKGMSDYGSPVTIGATEFMGARLAVEVLTSGTD